MPKDLLTETIKFVLRLNSMPTDPYVIGMIIDVINAAHARGMFGPHIETGGDALDVVIAAMEPLPHTMPIGLAAEVIRPLLAEVG